jgi:hypothetical protein
MRKEIISLAVSSLLVFCGLAPLPEPNSAASFAAPQTVTERLRAGEPKSGAVPAAPAPTDCLLGETQFVVEHPGGALKTVIELQADPGVDLYIRQGQRVTNEDGRIVADAGPSPFRRFIIPELRNTFGPVSFEPATYFVAVVNCGAAPAGFTLGVRTVEPDESETVDLLNRVPNPADGFLFMGTAPVPQSDACALAETQFTLPVLPLGPCGSGTSLGVAVRADQDVKLYVRRGQRVTVEGGQIVADFSTDTGKGAIVILDSFGPSPLPPGLYFIAIANCGTFIANYALVRGPDLAADAFPPIITSAGFERKNLLIFGFGFTSNAVLTIDGQPQEFVFVDQGQLIIRKARKRIKKGQGIVIRVARDANCRSPAFFFTRE